MSLDFSGVDSQQSSSSRSTRIPGEQPLREIISPGEVVLKKRKMQGRTSLVVQWLRLCAFNAEAMGSIPGWGIRVPHAAWQGQK